MFKETPAGELIEPNCHARLNCLKQLLDDVIFIQFNIKSYHISYTNQFNRMTNCCNKERQRSKPLSSLHVCATVTDDVLKLGYTSVILLDLGVEVDRTYYCDLLLSPQMLPAIHHISSEFMF